MMSNKQAKYIVQLQKKLIESQRKVILLYQELKNKPYDDYDEGEDMKQIKDEMTVVLVENKMLADMNEDLKKEVARLTGLVKKSARSRSPNPR